MSNENRARIAHERRILVALVNNLSAAGFKPAAVWTDDFYILAGDWEKEVSYDDAPAQIEQPMTLDEIIKVFDEYDMYQPTIHFTHQHLTTWGNRGVAVVPGNGCDFISDWHCGREGATGDIKAFNAIVDRVASAAGENAFMDVEPLATQLLVALRKVRDWMDGIDGPCPVPNPLASEIRVEVAKAQMLLTG